MPSNKNIYRFLFQYTFILTALLPLGAIAQKLSAFQNYTFISDFTQNSVQAIYQDKAGYIWIGTESGLNKYDGRRITNYKIGLNNNFILTSKRINQVTEDERGNLWLATSGGGINIIASKKSPDENIRLKILTDSLNKQIATGFVGCIKILRNKTVVIGMDSGICTYNPVNKQILKIPVFNYRSQHIRCDVVNIEEDEKGRCIVASSTGGLFVLDNNFTVTEYYSPELFEQGNSLQLIDILSIPGNLLFISSANGIYKVYPDSGQPPVRLVKSGDIDLSALRVNCMAYDKVNKWILLGSNTTGVVTIDTSGTVVDHLFDTKKVQKLHSNTIYSFFIDDTGLGYWIGTRSGLCKFFLAEDKFSTFQVKADEDGSALPIYPIYTEDNVHILTGTARSLVVHNLFTDEKKEVEIPGNKPLRFNSISKFTTGLYLYGTRDGIYYSSGCTAPVLNKISDKYPELKLADKFNILCFLPLNNDEILIGAKGDDIGGLILWNKNTKNVTHFLHIEDDPLSLPDNTINYMAMSSNGKPIICMNKGICYFNTLHHSFEPIFENSTTVLNYTHVSTVLSHDNTLWIGTYGGGLNKYNIANRTVEYITENNGLANNEIYAIQDAGSNEFWLSSNRGLILYNSLQKKIKNFDKSYGLINNEFNRTSTFKCRDTIYFGGLSGVNYFNYRNFKEAILPPAIDVSQISILSALEEKAVFTDSLDKLTVTYRQNTLKFYMASPFYINPAKTEFYYRLLPNQPAWISNGINNELIITQLPPGKHRLELKTKSSEGVFSSNIKTIYITVTPPWYQTWWFRLLLIFLIAGILYGFYKMRIIQFKKENKIRNQLASDLHDDLGSTLNSVKVYSNLAMMEKEKPEHLQHIKQGAQDAITGVRDIIWVLDDKKDSLNDMLARVSQFAASLCEASKVLYKVSADEEILQLKLGKEEKRNLYMIIKETINNSLKYAQCKNILLIAEKAGKNIRIEISDDGIGFNKSQISDGYGLKNIASRATAIGYRSEMITGPGSGTKLVLERN